MYNRPLRGGLLYIRTVGVYSTGQERPESSQARSQTEHALLRGRARAKLRPAAAPQRTGPRKASVPESTKTGGVRAEKKTQRRGPKKGTQQTPCFVAFVFRISLGGFRIAFVASYGGGARMHSRFRMPVFGAF